MKISVGVNVGHDAGVAVLDYSESKNGKLTVYEAERFSKVKHQALFPVNTLRSVILESKDVSSLPADHFAICCYAVGAKEKEESFIRHKNYQDLLSALNAKNFSVLTNSNITEISHHLCHAYSALYFSPFEESLIVVADGIGSNGDVYKNCVNDHTEDFDTDQINEKNFESISVYHQKGGQLTLVKKIWGKYYDHLSQGIFLNDGLGSYFASAANYIFGSWAEAGKVMGLSAFGKDQKELREIFPYLKSEFSKPRKLYKGKDLFDHQPADDFQRSADISQNLQAFFEYEVLSLMQSLKKEFPQIKNIILAGGCALNCLTNSKLVNLKLFDQVYIPPCPNDEGISIGAAYYKALQLGHTTFSPQEISQQNPYLGSRSIEKMIQDEEQVSKFFGEYTIEKCDDPSERAANLLCQGELIAWFQGRSECGPRALGNRSLLSLPSIENRKQYLNDHIKCRESFRPYGCTVTQESAHKYFDCPENYPMPFMSFAPHVRPEMRQYLSEVTHVDNTCRIQTITRSQNQRYYDLIKNIEEKMGHPLVLNTSLNVMGQPILETLGDASLFFNSTKINFMFIGKYLVKKHES